MDFKECIDFANAIHTCYIATVDGDQPRVRALGMVFADDKGFYFQTESGKSVCAQLKKNKKVALCFYGKIDPSPTMKMLRVAGDIEFLDDLDLKTKILGQRAFLKNYGINTPDNPRLVVFRVHKGEAFFWTMADNMKESGLERIKFGQ